MSKQPGPQKRYVDRPEVSETFADSIHGLSFDRQTMRIEFCTTRMDPPEPPKAPTARQYPICRLVLTPQAGIELYNQLQQIIQALEQAGTVKRSAPTPQTVQ